MPATAAALSHVLLATMLSLALPATTTPAALAPAPQQPAAAAPPVRVEWQRTLADALAVQQATGLPLLIAVNMNGEVFNEAFANQVYPDPAFVAKTRGYVCVVASPDRHTERDYDAAGNRVECPRFPGCTCSEHIAIEPALFERWFNGTRNAPRHLGVDAKGKVLFDRFLDQSMQTAIDAIGKHAGDAAKQPGTSDDLAQLFARRDAHARRLLEARWRRGDLAARRALLAAAANATNEPVDLLRAALRADDADLFGAAVLALAKTGGKDARIDLEDALARGAGADLERALVARLAELGKTDPGAARLAAHLAPGAPATLAQPWANTWRAPAFDAGDRAAVESELDRQEAALRTDPANEEARLALATAQLALAEILVRDGGNGAELWFADAIASARRIKATDLQPEAQAVVAYAAYMTGDTTACGTALARAQSATASDRQPSPFLGARLCEVAVLGVTAAVYASGDAAAERNLRPELDRVGAALALAAARGAPRENAMLAGAGLFEFAGLRARARALLADAAARFAGSAKVHEAWRRRLLVDLGADGMRREYAAYQRAAKDQPTAEWFAGMAALVAGDVHTKDELRDAALAAYGEAIERFARAGTTNSDYADSANHFAVLALAGRAELLAGSGRADAAAADLLRAHELRPESLDATDGLQRKPRAIAGRVVDALEKAGNTELAAKLKPLLP